MQKRDIAISTIGILDLLLGGIAMMYPEATFWWIGLLFAVSGIVLLLLLWVPILGQSFLRNPYILSRRVPNRLAEWRDWFAFKPSIYFADIIDERNTNYQASGSTVQTCNIFLDFTIVNNHKIGMTLFDFKDMILTLTQKRGGGSYDFGFFPLFNIDTEAKEIIQGVGVAHHKHITFRAEKEGSRREEAPNLELESTYTVKGIKVKLTGPLTVQRTFRPLKGYLLGRLE